MAVSEIWRRQLAWEEGDASKDSSMNRDFSALGKCLCGAWRPGCQDGDVSEVVDNDEVF